MLEFQLAKAKVNSVHSPVEFFGEDHRLACHIKFTLSRPNDDLSMLHPTLKSLLFRASDNADMVKPDHLPHVRFPQIAELDWEAEFSGVRVVISRDLGAGAAIALADCELKDIKLEPKEGGSVDLRFRIISHPSEELVGRLAALQQSEVLITVEQGAIRQEQEKVDRREKGRTIPAPEGGFPFPTNWEVAHERLNAAGFSVPPDEVRNWSGADIDHVLAFCAALAEVNKGGGAPKTPTVLKGRKRQQPVTH